MNNSFDGQAYWCDGCSRHQRTDYSPGHIIPFPIGSLISIPNPKYGGENFYSFRADLEGKMQVLPKDERVPRGKRKWQ